MDEKFTVEYQYQDYLKKVGLKEEDMFPVQKAETKRAFFGGVGHILALMKNEIAELPEDEGVQVLESLNNQVLSFFIAEAQSEN